MRLLIDTNLPRALAGWCIAKGYVCEHVRDIGLEQAKDRAIWSHAETVGAIIISKDADFADLARLDPSGPAVIWLRTGNGTTRDLLAFIEPLWPAIETRLANGERLVEVR